MAKRFGRNQRRKMQKNIEIVEALGQHNLDQAVRADLRYHDLKREMDDWESRLARALHPDNALHRKTREKSVQDRIPTRQVHFPQPLAVLPDGPLPSTVENVTERMHTYVLRIERDPYDYSRLIQWRELIDGKAWAYKVSDMVMRTCLDSDGLARFIATELMKAFQADTKRGRAA